VGLAGSTFRPLRLVSVQFQTIVIHESISESMGESEANGDPSDYRRVKQSHQLCARAASRTSASLYIRFIPPLPLPVPVLLLQFPPCGVESSDRASSVKRLGPIEECKSKLVLTLSKDLAFLRASDDK
jgi:hypothetical protein